MMTGVAVFSAATSAITNLLTNFDQENRALNKNLDILSKIKSDYGLPLDICETTKKTIK